MEVLDSMPALPVEHPVTPNIAPVMSPANAAAATNDPVLLFIVFSRLFCLLSNLSRLIRLFGGQAGLSRSGQRFNHHLLQKMDWTSVASFWNHPPV
jgi:hypothetical protein